MIDFTGKTIAVTGAANGIGRATALLLHRLGGRLVTGDLDVRGAMLAPDMLAVEADVATDGGERIAAACRAAGLVPDGLVNAAGIHAAGSVGETTPERWRDVMAVNLDAPFFLCRAAEPHLRAAAGSTIVNLSSASGLSPFANRSAYATSKGALITRGKVLAMEFAPAVRVNTICPGLVDTPMTAGLPGHGALRQTLERYALRRLGRDDEVAQAALFLTSSASSFVTGTTMAVDGGRTYH